MYFVPCCLTWIGQDMHADCWFLKPSLQNLNYLVCFVSLWFFVCRLLSWFIMNDTFKSMKGLTKPWQRTKSVRLFFGDWREKNLLHQKQTHLETVCETLVDPVDVYKNESCKNDSDYFNHCYACVSPITKNSGALKVSNQSITFQTTSHTAQSQIFSQLQEFCKNTLAENCLN